MQKIIEVFRVQRHDFINHLQVISGLLQLGKLDRVNEYIAKISQDFASEGLITRLDYPELVAVLLIKKMEAVQHGICFQFGTNTDLSEIKISEQMPVLVDFVLQEVIKEVVEKPGDEKVISVNINQKGQQCLFNISWLPFNPAKSGLNDRFTQEAEKCGCQLNFAKNGAEAGVSLLFNG